MAEELSCSFCGRIKTQTEVLIAGLDAHICDQCVDQPTELFKMKVKMKKTKNHRSI